MPWGAAIAAVAAIGGAAIQSDAAGDAADAQQAAADAATAEQRRQFNINQENQRPWLEAGGDALARQQAILRGDFSGFQESPDYLFALQQGQAATERGAAARGGLFGGGAQADLQQFGQGLATQNLNNYWNRLAGLSNTGQTTATNLGSYGQAFGQQYGQNMMDAANARASSYAGQANAWGNALGQAGSAFGQYWGNRGQTSGGGGNIGPVVKQPITG